MQGVVPSTNDFRRIRDLPRRVWQQDPDLDELVRLMSWHLMHNPRPCARPKECVGCRTLGGLLPAQAVCLRESTNLRGGVGALRVGAGKTLVSFLIAALLVSERPLLVVPASVIKQTRAEYRQYARHWKIPPLEIVTYSFLGHPNNREWLLKFKPTLLVLDEAQNIKSLDARVTKRVGHFKKAHPEVPLITLTGSLTDRSVQRYRHYMTWALGGGAPVPRDPFEAQSWAMCLDEKLPDEDLRVAPGPLLTLAPSGQSSGPNDLRDELERARNAYRDRLTSTPGVVSTLEDIPAVGLRIWVKELELPATVKVMLDAVRDDNVLPGGEEFVLALDEWRHERSLGVGLYYKWDPPAPREWMLRRKEWFAFVRQVLTHSRTKDSIAHVAEAIDAGTLEDGGLLRRWREIEPTFVPNSVPVWVDDTAVTYANSWLEQTKGLVWVGHAAFGRRLSELSGVPFFSRNAATEAGMHISEWRGESAILSYQCRTGLNLQDRWSRNLAIVPPPTGEWAEQFIGRTHRKGQDEDEVTVEFLLSSRGTYFTLAQCVRDARMDESSHGQPRKLSYANAEWGPVAPLIEQLDRDTEIGA